MAKAVETYRGTEIFLTADRTLVTPPKSDWYCIDGPERDWGPTLTTFATLEEAREYIDDMSAIEARRANDWLGTGSRTPRT